MKLKILDPVTLDSKGHYTAIRSAKWIKRFYSYGSFEMSLKKCNIAKYDVVRFGIHEGIVMEIEKNLFDEVIIRGYDLGGLTEFRLIDGGTTFTNRTAKYIYRELVSRYCTASTNRKIEKFRVTAGFDDSALISEYITEIRPLSEELSKLAQLSDIGFDIYITAGYEYMFTEISPNDNTRLIFSPSRRTISDGVLVDSGFNSKNVVYYPNNGLVAVGSASGIYRREGYTETKADANKYLAEKKETKSIDAKAGNLYKYGTDYSIGDIVTVQFDDFSESRMITEVEFTYTPLETVVYPTFGKPKENLLKKVLKG